METATSPWEKFPFVQRLRLFSDVSPADCRTIVSTALEKRFTRRETIFFEGDPVRQVVLLLSGFVKTTQLGFAGAEVILRLSGVGDIVSGFCQPGANCSHCSTAQAIRPSTALVWQAATFDKLPRSLPGISTQYRSCSRRTTAGAGAALSRGLH